MCISFQIRLLIILFVLHGINAFVVSPLLKNSMTEMFQLEKESGKAYHIGIADVSDLKKDPTYAKVNKRFRRIHGLCGVINMLSLCANTIHLYRISAQCEFA